MPYDFVGENLVYIPPPEVTGYTWTSSGGGADTAPTERWERNADFDPNSILDIKTDKYGRTVSSLKADASEADIRAYNLSRNYDPSDWQVKTEMQTGANPDWENIQNQGFWDVDPAIQERWQAANRANSGNAVGMSGWQDWVVPASIIGGGLATAYFAPAASLAAPAWDAAFAYGAGALPEIASAGAGAIATEVGQQAFFDALAAGANSTEAINAGMLAESAIPATTSTAAEIYSNPTTEQMVNFANARPDPIQALTELQSMTPSELSTALGSGAGSDFLSSASDALKTANQVRQGVGTASAIAKLVGGGTTGTTGTTGTGGLDLNKLASLLKPQTQTNDFLGQYKMNQNPFAFTTQGQTVAAPGTYDVSGSNMANALRKA